MNHDQVKSCKHKAWTSQMTALSHEQLRRYFKDLPKKRQCNKNRFKENNTWIVYKIYMPILEMAKALKTVIISSWSTAYHFAKSVCRNGHITHKQNTVS